MSNATAPDVLSRDCIHTLIDRQARLAPDAPAVFAGEGMLSYRQLVDRADRLAHVLVAAGVVPETLVGICVDRSVDMVVAVLAILKSGGAFVPLDPAYPADRLAFMIEDSQAPIILAQSHTSTSLGAYAGTTVLLDTLDLSENAPALSESIVQPEHLAYVVYTSGSTGRPKGVMIEHRSVVSFLAWTRARFTDAQMSRVLCSSSLSFDVSFFEIFAPLAVGGALVIIRDALELLTVRLREPVTTMSTVASALAEVVRARALPMSLTTILQAGEYLPQSLAKEVYATSNVSELLNLCGATEDTIYSESFLVPRDVPEDPPIGRPFLHRHVYILDEHLQPVPQGTPGEICYGGTGVARGYLNRPELTAERFVPNPFAHSPTMYRSGDIVVERENGEIYYLRRNDQQVKVRGFRIELGEIEAVLREHPGVDSVAVLAREVGGSKSLAAYAVERSYGSLAVDEVQAFVAARLPDYMVPTTLVLLDSMPMGPSGKLDRDALGRLDRRRPELAAIFEEPRNPYEKKIAEKVSELVGLDRVGVRDNFFALGGQSLLAARLVSEVRGIFPVENAALEARAGANALLTTFFVEPTVESLAAALLSSADAGGDEGITRMRRVQEGAPGRTPLFLLHGVIHGEAFYIWNLAQGLGPDQPVYALAPHGYQGENVPETIEEMAAEYLAEIRKIQPVGPYHLAGYCNGGFVAFEMARMLEAHGEKVASLLVISASARNLRFAKIHDTVEITKILPGFSAQRRRSLFLSIRGRLLILEERRSGKSDWLASLLRIRRRSNGRREVLAPELEGINRERRDQQRYVAFLRAIEAYIPRRYGGNVCLIWGETDNLGSPDDPYNGWREIAASVDLHIVPGDHNFLESSPELIVKHLRNLIAAGEQATA